MQGDQQLKADVEAAVKGFKGSKSELLRFPMSLGDLQMDRDHSGEPCTVLDIVLSPRVVQLAKSSRRALQSSTISVLMLMHLQHTHHLAPRDSCVSFIENFRRALP